MTDAKTEQTKAQQIAAFRQALFDGDVSHDLIRDLTILYAKYLFTNTVEHLAVTTTIFNPDDEVAVRQAVGDAIMSALNKIMNSPELRYYALITPQEKDHAAAAWTVTRLPG